MELEIEIVAEGLAFPEGPVVMADESVIVVEMLAGRLTRCWGDGRKETVAEPGGGPNGAAIGPDGALYICNNGGIDPATLHSFVGPGYEGRIERIDIATGKVERLYDRGARYPLSGPNDLVFAADGSFWFTDQGKTWEDQHGMGGLFHAQPDGSSITTVDHGILYYNGVGLSPDGATVYVADTYTARMLAYPADAGAGAKPRLVATVPGLVGLDSLAVTRAGNICAAQLFEGAIATITPEGQVSRIPFPDHYTTNIAFGGADMRTAWICQSSTGRLIKARWPEPGLELAFNA